MEVTDIVKDLSMDYFRTTSIYDKLQKCLSVIETSQETMCTLTSGTEDGTLTLLKVGSMLSFSIFGKMFNSGKMPKEFQGDDWEEIANKVVKYGILMDGQVYTEFIFGVYAEYISRSVEINQNKLSEKSRKEISGLADELGNLTKSLENGRIKETDYVDRCLWVCFEAMIKLIAAYKTSFLNEKNVEYAEFIQAICDLAVQYARLSMYSKENALLEEYINNQYKLDGELRDKFDNFIMELEERTSEFDILIEKAFDPEFKSLLKSSVDLAKSAGVSEDKILDSMNKIDDFFS